jgi:tetratricopeptide (TPR) repeat protein
MPSTPYTEQELLQSGIALARAGSKIEARDLLEELVENYPANAMGWIWLSDLRLDLRQRVMALEKALQLRPNDPRLQDRLRVMLSQLDEERHLQAGQNTEWLRQAEDAQRQGRPDLALDLARHVVSEDRDSQPAWWLVASLAPDAEEQQRALREVCRLDPSHREARQRLQALERIQEHPLLFAQACQERGQYDLALALYRRIRQSDAPRETRLEAAARENFVTFYQRFPEAKPVSPTWNLVRLSSGPLLLFLAMLFVQSGLNPLRLSLLPALGLPLCVVGSTLLALTFTRPLHPWWMLTFGSPGSGDEPLARTLARLAGVLLLLASFALLLLDSFGRLQAYLSSLGWGG